MRSRSEQLCGVYTGKSKGANTDDVTMYTLNNNNNKEQEVGTEQEVLDSCSVLLVNFSLSFTMMLNDR